MKVDQELSGAGQVGRIVDGLIRLDVFGVLEGVADARRQEPAAAVIGRVILPAARELHRRYRVGTLDAVALTAGTALARRALSRAAEPITVPPGAPARRSIVVVAPPGAGGLDAEGAYEALLATGNPAQLLVGVDDAEVLGRHLASLGPLAVVAASAEPRTIPALAILAAIAARAGVPVLAAGEAFGTDGARAASIGATIWVAEPTEMIEVLDGWRVAGGALAMHVQEPADAAAVRAVWPAVVMAASGSGGPDEAWARTTLKAIGEVMVSSLWTNDVTVVLDWLDEALAGPDQTQVRDMHLMGLFDAVSLALPRRMEAPSAMLDAGRDRLRQHMLHPGHPERTNGSGAPETRPEVAPATPVAPPPGAAAGSVGPAGAATPTGRALEPATPAELRPAAAPVWPHLTAVPTPAGGEVAGQVFADLLLLGALSAQAAVAAVAVLQPGNRWSTLAHGLEQRDGLNDALMWSTIAGRHDAVEIADLAVHPDLQRSPLAQRPVFLRWAYGIALRDPEGSVIGVFCLLDRSLRKATRREQRVLVACARQLTSHLLGLRRPSPLVAVPSSSWAAPRPVGDKAPVAGRGSVSLTEGQQLLRSHEVAVLFDVTERTVINWAAAGKLPSLRTIGGHLRFRSEDVYGLLSARRAGT